LRTRIRTAAIAVALCTLTGLGITTAQAATHTPSTGVSQTGRSAGNPPPTGINQAGQPIGTPAGAAPFASAVPNYEYSASFVPGSGLANVTSGSVQMSVQEQGLAEPDKAWTGDHSLGNLVVVGTCASGNTSCTSSPLVELHLIQGPQYCKANADPCFAAYSWKNGAETFANGYVNAGGTFGLPDDGSYHPALGSTYKIGFTLSYQRLNVTINGNIVGWWQTSYWGQTTFGPITEESVQSEVYAANPNWTGSPIPSMDYAFSNFTDNAGNTLPAPSVSTPYTTSNPSGSGWTVSGGTAPSDSGTYWGVEASRDNGLCLDNTNNSSTNGNKVQVWTCNGNAAQGWRYNPSTGELVNSNGKCLDDTGHSSTNGTKVQIWACLGDPAQQWTAILTGNSFVEFKNTSANVCLDNTGNSGTNGTQVQVWSCNGDAAQAWDAPLST